MAYDFARNPEKPSREGRAWRALNRLAKWRLLLVGRILGTRSDKDPVAQGYRDIFNTLLVLRAEVTAQTELLVEKGVITREEWDAKLAEVAEYYDGTYRERFPGWESADHGLTAVDVQRAAEVTKGWPA